MFIKCELLDIIRKLIKELNGEWYVVMKLQPEGYYQIEPEIIGNNFINRNLSLNRPDLDILR